MTEDSGDIVPLRGSPLAEQHLEKLRAAHAAGLKVIDAPAAPAPEPLRWRAPDLAALITERARIPWISLRLGMDSTEFCRVRLGSLVVLTAPSGAGKSSLAIETARRHAADVGPVVYVTPELDADEVGARIVSQICDVSWEEATRGLVEPAHMANALNLPRMLVLAREDATIARAELGVAQMRADYPDQPTLVVVDYLQLLEGDGKEERLRVAGVVESLRRMTQRLGVVTLAVSQTSRASARALGAGELAGAETTATGAETAQIERAATITVALGGMRQRDDGRTSVDISIGKGRMGQGDAVFPATYDGRTGAWRIEGPAVSGLERRAARDAATGNARVTTAALAIRGHLATVTEPVSRSAIREALALRKADVVSAVQQLISDPTSGVVEVRGRRTGTAWPLWVRDRAEANGIQIVPNAPGNGMVPNGSRTVPGTPNGMVPNP